MTLAPSRALGRFVTSNLLVTASQRRYPIKQFHRKESASSRIKPLWASNRPLMRTILLAFTPNALFSRLLPKGLWLILIRRCTTSTLFRPRLSLPHRVLGAELFSGLGNPWSRSFYGRRYPLDPFSRLVAGPTAARSPTDGSRAGPSTAGKIRTGRAGLLPVRALRTKLRTRTRAGIAARSARSLKTSARRASTPGSTGSRTRAPRTILARTETIRPLRTPRARSFGRGWPAGPFSGRPRARTSRTWTLRKLSAAWTAWLLPSGAFGSPCGPTRRVLRRSALRLIRTKGRVPWRATRSASGPAWRIRADRRGTCRYASFSQARLGVRARFPSFSSARIEFAKVISLETVSSWRLGITRSASARLE